MKEYLLKLSDLKRDAPYCRFRWICDWSSQEFYEDYLQPIFKYVVEQEAILVLDVTSNLEQDMLYSQDGMWGWEDELFGRLFLDFGADKIRKHLQIIAANNTSEESIEYIIEKVSDFYRNFNRENKGVVPKNILLEKKLKADKFVSEFIKQ